MRSGVIAQKVGMTRVYNDAGEHVPVHRAQARQLPGRGAAHRREERLYRRPARRRPAQGEEHAEGAARPFRAAPRSSRSAKVAEFRVSPGQPDRRRRRDHRRPFRRRPVRRRHRHLDRQGLPGRHQAPPFRRRPRHPRQLGLAPHARLDRPAPGPRQGVQGQEDGRPHGRRSASPRRTSRSSRPTSTAA